VPPMCSAGWSVVRLLVAWCSAFRLTPVKSPVWSLSYTCDTSCHRRSS
jgi:hypothetical protein